MKRRRLSKSFYYLGNKKQDLYKNCLDFAERMLCQSVKTPGPGGVRAREEIQGQKRKVGSLRSAALPPSNGCYMVRGPDAWCLGTCLICDWVHGRLALGHMSIRRLDICMICDRTHG